MTVQVRGLELDQSGDIEAAHAIEVAVFAHYMPDLPVSRRDFIGRLHHDWPGNTSHHWLAWRDGAPAGRLTVSLPQLDNTHLADVYLTVHPEHVRRGVGRALYDTALAFARESGRRVLQGEYVQPSDGADVPTAFAEAMGAKSALPEIRRRLHLPTVDRAAWKPLLADALSHADGYTLLRWRDRTPDDIVADVANLEGRLVIDAPMGDLILEQENVDADRVQAVEDLLEKLGRRAYHAGARHDATGRLAAWTLIAFEADEDEHAWQQITIVDPDHRGHRLGTIVKIDNMYHVLEHEPQVVDIDTFNAAVNDHMIGINEKLGYRRADDWIGWQAEI